MSPEVVERLYRDSGAERWEVPLEAFAEAVDRSVRHAFGERPPGRAELTRYLQSLHAADLALACACERGHDVAWEQFVTRVRPALYRAAGALDPSGGGRELADSIYAELYGVRESSTRGSLFRYFHGRSTIVTWLRAILAQRHVDRIRSARRLDPLPEDDAAPEARPAPDADRSRLIALMSRALRAAIAGLAARDRLRLRAYYEQDLTLAQIGRLTSEHEATVSRQLARTRKAIRKDVDDQLRQTARLSDDEVRQCWEEAIGDAGPLDLRDLFGLGGERKNPAPERS